MRWTALALVAVFAAGVACDRGTSPGSSAQARRPQATKPGQGPNAGQAAGDETGAESKTEAEGKPAAPETYAYDATGKRDPFRSFVLERARELAETERGPLEQFDLSQLVVVAVVWGTERPRALITDPSGRGYVIQEGTAIGKNEGQVIRIDDSLVVVRETYVDYVGERTLKEIEMQIRQSEGG